MTPFISIQESYFFLSLADKLQFNAFFRAGLQATTCDGFGGTSVSENESPVSFDRRFTANGVQIQEIC